jgi:hypothetical protein
MNNINRLLVWRKWEHPLKKISENFLSLEDEMDEGDDSAMLSADNLPAALYFDPDKYLHLWTADTTFYVTAQVRKVVEGTPGVCYFKQMHPYRFNMGVGELFNQNTVKKEVATRLMVEAQDDLMSNCELTFGDNLSVIEEIRSTINTDYWAIYVFPTGQKKVITAQHLDESFQAELELLKDVKDEVGGYLTTYQDE